MISRYSKGIIRILRISNLGFVFLDKIKLFLIHIVISLFFKLGIKKTFIISINLNILGKKIRVFLTSPSDFFILREIFLDNEYNIDLKNDPSVIVDLGSNVGFSAIYFAVRYPNARIYAFEPDPVTFEKLRRNCGDFNNISCYNLAVSDIDGKIDFYIYPGSNAGSSLVKRKANQEVIKINAKKLDSIWGDLGLKDVDLVKFDIEGAEYSVFKNFNSINLVRNFIGEVHLDLIKANEQEFNDIFNNYNIKTNRISDKRYILIAHSHE